MTPFQAAISGMGWEDLQVRFHISERAARALVWAAAARRDAMRICK